MPTDVNPNYSSAGNPDPTGYAAAVVPADTDLAGGHTRGIYVGVTGNLTVKMSGDGAIVTFKNVLGGVIYPLRVTQVRVGTTASELVVCY